MHFEKNQIVSFVYNNDGVERTLTIDKVRMVDGATLLTGYRLKYVNGSSVGMKEGRSYYTDKMSNIIRLS